MLMEVVTRGGGGVSDVGEVDEDEADVEDFFFRFFFPSPLPICSMMHFRLQ